METQINLSFKVIDFWFSHLLFFPLFSTNYFNSYCFWY